MPRYPALSRFAAVIAAGAAVCLAQTSPAGYQSELAAARAEVVQSGHLTIRDFELGTPHPGKNSFTAMAKNDSDNTLTLGLDLRAVPGLWLAPNVQLQYLFPLAPHEERQISGDYEFSRLSAESTLRVRFFFPEVKPDGVTEFGKPFFEKKYSVGQDNPADDFDVAKLFEKRITGHFVIYCARSLGPSANLDKEVEQREAAYRRISQMLGVTSPQPIRLVFYADAASKTRDTHHIGDGLAYDETIIEIYGKVDLFHELTHVLAGQLGDPPALFNEGLAVYVSELMGADALKDLGSPGMKIDEAVAAHRRLGNFIPIDTLFTYTDIGPDESKPTISYPEAASFVKFLITKYGLASFRQAYRTLESTDVPDGIRRNREAFRAIYGRYPGELEAEWLRGLPASMQ